ncbi:DUF3114 domain-containing protein [Streptococcus dentasini]
MDKIGSPVFYQCWEQLKTKKTAHEALHYLLDSAGMPEELSGDLEENRRLLSRFADDLAPHDNFWKDLARLVRRAMKEGSFTEETSFNRRLHQLRYVISSQQAQYVRRYYRQSGMTDQAALIAYLKVNRLRPNIFDNARLHNKRQSKQEAFAFPDQRESYNIKILLQLRTEFILDSQGYFLNELDADKVNINGIVNGASFNYGNTPWSHVRLDVEPIRAHDPIFRKAIVKPFKSPNQAGKIRLARFWKERKVADFERSFYNRQGGFAKDGQSLARLIKLRKKSFKREYKRK